MVENTSLDTSKTLLPLSDISALVLNEKTVDAKVVKEIHSFFEDFFNDMSEHLKILQELQDRHVEELKDLGVPGLVNFDARLYQVVLHPNASPETMHFFTNHWPGLTLNAEALKNAWTAYDESPTEQHFDALVSATHNFNEMFTTFQTGVTALIEKAPDERVPKAPPSTV